MTTRTQFLAQFATPADAIAFEDETLSIGSEFLPACAIAVRNGGEPTSDYYAWLLSQVANDLKTIADAHRIGRECCEFWLDYLDQPGTPADPADWELSHLDRETACIELGVEFDEPAVLTALEAGFAERRGELSDEYNQRIRAERLAARMSGAR